ncbi:MAG: pilus assembly PilX N-terminal domain-containing protein [Candidatus Omnitrophota bacterium]|nr:pilus assembly PilX N-terminal domain-containing protein [Candidatus Omnitrophota bacterium]
MSVLDKKGIALMLALGVIAVITLAIVAIVTVSNNEVIIGKHQDDSVGAFYLAESGLEKARTQLNLNWANTADVSGTLGAGSYTANIYNTEAGGAALPADLLRIRSSGSVDNAARTIEVVMKDLIPPAPGSIISAIATEGTLSIKGNVVVTGDVEENAVISFENAFGMPKTQMEDIVKYYFPDTYYDRAFANGDSASKVTWVNGSGDESTVSDNEWIGEGIFIVNGDFHITGGTFNGVLWVEGDLSISGNPEINGTIFVKSGVTVDTTITGTADVTFSEEIIDDAFDTLRELPPTIESWKEM